MKSNVKAFSVKRTRARKSGKTVLNGKKSRSWKGFSPEFCGIMAGPSDLSMREGLSRG